MSKVWHPVAGAGARKLQAVRRSVFLLLCVSALATAAQSQPDPMPRKDAASWLAKIHREAAKQNYVGTLTYQRGFGKHYNSIQH